MPTHISGKGTGGYTPSPNEFNQRPDIDENVGMQQDGEGATYIRGQILTDEGSYRDDFTKAFDTLLTGSILFTKGSSIIEGTNTLFTEELDKDCYIRSVNDISEKNIKIKRIFSNTYATLYDNYDGYEGISDGYKSFWIKTIGSGGSIEVVDSYAIITSGVGNNSISYFNKDSDYLPIIFFFRSKISQRINNQEIYIGFFDDISNPLNKACILFSGTDNTKLVLQTSFDSDVEQTTVTLPFNSTTEQILNYQLDLSAEQVVLSVNDTILATHMAHIPGPYAELYPSFITKNIGIPSSSTLLYVDTSFISNHNQLQVSNIFRGESLPVRIREDTHYLTGRLITTSTTSDQVIVSYKVPTNKTCYIIGYYINQDGSNVDGTIKIGRNDLSTEITSPGSVDGNIFRCFKLFAKSSSHEDFSASPRRIGFSDDTIKITTTPTGTQNTNWRVTLDIVLR